MNYTSLILTIIMLVVLPLCINYYLFVFRPARRNKKIIELELGRASSEREYLYWKNELRENRWEYVPFSDKFRSSQK